ncbi:RING-type E3 ubiquitin transferase [Heracleum sosnowskyi]|uniref:RING-type E3 ubiquitin transferase n=1 Tax=Heracleum sosnowskyi TaxID=360622 RepID=A0AAD8MSZ6_9APIA|nr:RING-type E3 ubiquitin transferase [Heracleum sosnowskyi]
MGGRCSKPETYSPPSSHNPQHYLIDTSSSGSKCPHHENFSRSSSSSWSYQNIQNDTHINNYQHGEDSSSSSSSSRSGLNNQNDAPGCNCEISSQSSSSSGNPQENHNDTPVSDFLDSFPALTPGLRLKGVGPFLAHNHQPKSLEEVTVALAIAGLESYNLIVGIDFTRNNEWTGARSYNKRSLHQIGDELNPYEQAISIIGKTLVPFDQDNWIPCFGFGDESTLDQDVFNFYPENDGYCNGFEEVLSLYREVVPHGPISFVPIIEMAMTIVEQSNGQFHVLVIIAGQVPRSVDTGQGQLSPEELKTVDAIVKASNLPLYIILVGVGDGPWDMMDTFKDNMPKRNFDNFQFVNFTDIMSHWFYYDRREALFALTALMPIASRYKASIELKMLGSRKGDLPTRLSLPPPVSRASNFSSLNTSQSTIFLPSAPPYDAYFSPPRDGYFSSPYDGYFSPPYDAYSSPVGTAPPVSSSSFDNMVCPICLSNSKDMAFGCGHQTCCECGNDLLLCPICRSLIEIRIKLYY